MCSKRLAKCAEQHSQRFAIRAETLARRRCHGAGNLVMQPPMLWHVYARYSLRHLGAGGGRIGEISCDLLGRQR